jgi:hypothetical protein
MNRAVVALLIGAVLSKGVCSAPARGTGHEERDFAQGIEESVALPHGTALHAELDTQVDSKKAKTGDAVTAHLTESVKVNGQTVIPKNAKLVGRVTQASARVKGDVGSALTLVFDKAIVKKGQETPLRLMIQAIAAAPAFTPDASPDTAKINDGLGAAQGSPMGSPRPSPDRTPSVVGEPASADEKSAGAPSGSRTGLDSTGRLTSNSRGVFGLEGLHLATDAASPAEGSQITSSGKSVRLDSGIRLILVAE